MGREAVRIVWNFWEAKLVRRRPFYIIGKTHSLRVAAAIACMLASVAGAAGAGIESCEKIKDADAYNSCLASYGPAVGEHKFTRAPAPESEAEPPRPGQSKAVAGKGRARKAAHEAVHAERQGPKRQANGRVRIEIFPGQ
jgi:hypothetical protein